MGATLIGLGHDRLRPPGVSAAMTTLPSLWTTQGVQESGV
jgi:hypothetical protein